MLRIARERMPRAQFVRGEALPLLDRSFDRVFTSNFYGHLEQAYRFRLLDEARRVAPELVIVDCAWEPGLIPEGPEERFLGDGSRWVIHKCYFTPEALLGELGGGDLLFHGPPSWPSAAAGDPIRIRRFRRRRLLRLGSLAAPGTQRTTRVVRCASRAPVTRETSGHPWTSTDFHGLSVAVCKTARTRADAVPSPGAAWLSGGGGIRTLERPVTSSGFRDRRQGLVCRCVRRSDLVRRWSGACAGRKGKPWRTVEAPPRKPALSPVTSQMAGRDPRRELLAARPAPARASPLLPPAPTDPRRGRRSPSASR
jgi:hypothetical protein